MKFVLDDLAFNTDTPDAQGVYWYVQAFEGWDSPPVRSVAVEPSSRHGSVLARTSLGPRALTMSGLVKAPNSDEFYKAYNYLLGKTSMIFKPVFLTVSEEIDRIIAVVRAAEVRLDFMGVNAFAFQIPLTAYDPLKYNTTVTSTSIPVGQTKTITNIGNFISEAVTVTVGAGGGYPGVANLTYDDVGIRTDQGLGAGAIFNLSERVVRNSNGKNKYGALAPSSAWWGLQSGANQVKNTGNVAVTVKHYSAWL